MGVAFNDGLLGQGSFLARASFDFLDAAQEVAELEESELEESGLLEAEFSQITTSR